jgi:hypothetical protein
MPLYHFDLVNTRTVTDHGGEVLPDDVVARTLQTSLRGGCSRRFPT